MFEKIEEKGKGIDRIIEYVLNLYKFVIYKKRI